MILKFQGCFRELVNGDKNDPSICDYIQNKPNINEEKIIEYLESGIVIISCGGVVEDVINPCNGYAGCPELITDGIWVWSGDLKYYVKKYHIKLDSNFIDTMKKNNWRVDKKISIDYDNLKFVKDNTIDFM